MFFTYPLVIRHTYYHNVCPIRQKQSIILLGQSYNLFLLLQRDDLTEKCFEKIQKLPVIYKLQLFL